jgi:hypothetical protein
VASVIAAVVTVIFWTGIAVFLYKKKIFIKI